MYIYYIMYIYIILCIYIIYIYIILCIYIPVFLVSRCSPDYHVPLLLSSEIKCTGERIIPADTFDDRGSTFPLKWLLNDGAP